MNIILNLIQKITLSEAIEDNRSYVLTKSHVSFCFYTFIFNRFLEEMSIWEQ